MAVVLALALARPASCQPAPAVVLPKPPQCSEARGAAAIRLLQARVQQEKLYASWARPQCLSFVAESCDATTVDLAIREVHNEVCGGDPSTAPVVDRFRLHRPSRRIQWYDAANGEYLAFEKIHSIGRR